MSTVVNILEMPMVTQVIISAENKIKKLTGIEIKLMPIGEFVNGTNAKKNILKQLIEKMFDVKWEDVVKKNRQHDKVYARYYYMWVCVKYLQQSLSVTGRELGDRDHTTIINGITTIKKHIKKNDYRHLQLLDLLEEFKKLESNETKN